MKRLATILALCCWGLYALAQPPNITAMEYYIDTDPGYGNGTTIPITVGITQDTNFSVPTSTLSLGFHALYTRAMDANGAWGQSESKAFFVSQSTTETRENITAMEYYFDLDPGQGNGTTVTITPNTDLDITEMVAVSSLPIGFHTVSFRVQAASGVWSLTENKAFYIAQATNGILNNLSAIEYFIDTDPGHGNGTQISITAANNINIVQNIPVASLALGIHTITIRGQNENGVWSQVESRPFFIDNTRTVNLLEYAIDTDPGIGMGIQSAYVDPVGATDTNLIVPTTGLGLGNHTIILRTQDDKKAWSVTSTVNFAVCDGALADFTIGSTICKGSPASFTDISTNGATGDVYSWDFDGDGVEDDNTVGDANFTFTTAGTFEVTLTLDRLGCISSITKTIVVNDLPPVVANTTATDICLGEEITLTGSGATSYVWDNGVSDNVAFSPATTTTYTVTGTDVNGCTNTSMVAVNVLAVDQPTITVVTSNSATQVVLSSSSEVGNQWFIDGTLIEGATAQALEVPGSGIVTVQVTIDGCLSQLSAGFDAIVLGLGDKFDLVELTIWPNPADDELFIQSKWPEGHPIAFSIFDLTGKIVQKGAFDRYRKERGLSINIEGLQSGAYLMILNNENTSALSKFIKH